MFYGISHAFAESTVSSVPSPLSVVTTTPAIPDKDYEEAEGDSTPSTLVRYGLFCKNIQAFDVDGVPQSSEVPLKITIYELKSPPTANTLHLLLHSPKQPYKYIVLMAINEKGVPAGHFHHQVCSDPTIFNGWHNMGRYCTRRDGSKGEKWGVSRHCSTCVEIKSDLNLISGRFNHSDGRIQA